MRFLLLLLFLGSCGDGDPADETEESESRDPIPLDFVDDSRSYLGQIFPTDQLAPLAIDFDRNGHVDLLEVDDHGVYLMASFDSERLFAPVRIVNISAPAGLIAISSQPGAVFVSGSADGDRLIRGSESTTRPEVVAFASQSAVASTGDIDGDGHVDLVAFGILDLDDEDAEPELLHFRGTDSGLSPPAALRWAPRGPLTVQDIAIGDIDGDGHADLVLSADGHVPLVLVGDGQGNFLRAPPTTLVTAPGVGRHVALVDIDLDGDLDLVLAGDGPPRLFYNQRSRFEEVSDLVLPQQPMKASGLSVRDLDLDGQPEILIARADGPLMLLRSDDRGRFFDYSDVITSHPASIGATGMVVADLDRDGDPDIYLTLSDLRRPRVWRSWHPLDLPDRDGDRVPDSVDVCPDDFDPNQGDQDFDPFSCSGTTDCASQTGCSLHWIERQAYLRCTTSLTWHGAAEFCARRGTPLLVPQSAEHAELLLDAGLYTGWLGVTDEAEEGVFITQDGEPPPYTPWAEGEPNNAGDGEDCVEGRSNGEWNDRACDRTLPFTCWVAEPYVISDPGDVCDVCPEILDPDQTDSTGDGRGDACDWD